MANTPMYAFRFVVAIREQMRALATARGISLSEALHEAAVDWIRKQERRPKP